MPPRLAHDSCVRTDHAAVRVRDSYSGCSRLAKLAIAAMETVGSSCGGAGIACQQRGRLSPPPAPLGLHRDAR